MKINFVKIIEAQKMLKNIEMYADGCKDIKVLMQMIKNYNIFITKNKLPMIKICISRGSVEGTA